MSEFRKILTFRVNDSTPDDHVGRRGEITFRDGFLYYHDGNTPGGEIISGGGSGGGGPTSWNSITGKPSFAAVATSGSYNDLTNKPTLTTGPQGPKGDKGDTGPMGPAGANGGTGPAGATGPQGPQGLKGDKGDTGAQGPAGADGQPGLPGANGADGADGVGVPAGGTAGQVLAKVDGTDYNTEWVTPTGGSGSGQTFNQSLNTTDNVAFNKVTVTGSQGIEDADGMRITNINVDGKVYVGSNLTQAPVSVLIGGAGPRSEWAFTPDGKLTLPEVGTGIGWTNTDTAPTPDTEFLYSSTISFDKNQGIVLNNAVGADGFSWTLGKDGKLTAPGDIITGTNGGRFVQDCADGTSSIRWINMPSNTSESFARVYTNSGTNSGEWARFALNWLDENRSAVTISAWDRTGETTRRGWDFRGDGKLQLPADGDIVNADGNSVLSNRSRGPSSVSVVVLASDENANTITVGGDRTELFAVGESVWSTASTEFVPQYFFLVTDVAYDGGLDQTVITLGNSIGSTVYTGSDLYSVINFNSFNEILPGDNIAFDFVNNSLVINSTGGSSSATTLSSLTDVALEGPVEGSVLTWNDTQGHWENRSLPSSSEITNTDGINNYNVSVSPEGIVTMRTARGNLEFGAQPEEGAPQHFHIMRPAGMEGSTDLYFGDDYNYFKLPGNYGAGTLGVDIGANDGVGGAQQVWRFGTDGTLTLPAGGDIKDSTGASVLGGGTGPGLGNFVFNGSVLAMNDDAEDMSIKAPDDLYLDALGDDVFVRADDDIRLRAGVNFDEDTYRYAWNFRDTGELAFYSDASDGEHGRITMTTDSANNQRVLEIGGIGQVHIKTDMSIPDESEGNNKTWKFDVDGNLTLPEGGDILDSNGNSVLSGEETAPQYGYFTELVETGSSNQVEGQAVVMDTDGNSYVSFIYYNNSLNREIGCVAKYSSTGEQLWAVTLASQNPDARHLDIRSLEFVTGDADPALIAMGHYYDNNTSKDVAFIFYINPATGSVGEPMVGRELVAQNGMNVKDGVAGYDGSNTYAVVVGETYEQVLTKIFTPLAGSTTNKMFVSWAEFAGSGVNAGETVYYTEGPNTYGMSINSVSVTANVAGSTDPAWAGLSIVVGVNQAGNYVIRSANGWGYLVNSWPVPVTLTVAGSALGGVDGVNDLTFDFDGSVFNNSSSNLQAAISNIMGMSPVSGAVYCTGWGDYDWSTQVGNALTFNYHLNSQAYVARFGQTTSWTKNFGGAEYDRMNSVAVDNSGNIYAVGRSWGGSKGALVVKYDIYGTQQWAVYIDPDNNTGNELTSVDLLSDGNIITVDEEGVVTKLDSSDGSIIWQVRADNGPSWDSDFRGTATPDGDYIITNYEDDDYTQYVMRVSGSDGSSVWNKRIRRAYGGENGELRADDDSQYIDCNETRLTIAGRSEQPNNGNDVGIVYSFPINGENTDGTYGQFVITSPSMDWETLTTTSTPATVNDTSISVTVSSASPTSSSSLVNVTTTTKMGGEPIVEPTVITWTNPNDNVWRIEYYNGGAAVSYDGGDNDAKWFDIANHTSGNSDFRGAVIQYHAFVQNLGTIIGTIHLSNDNTQPSATHTEHLSGNSDLQLVTLWDCNYDRGQLYFKMTDGSSRNVMIQWTSTVFYGQEWND